MFWRNREFGTPNRVSKPSVSTEHEFSTDGRRRENDREDSSLMRLFPKACKMIDDLVRKDGGPFVRFTAWCYNSISMPVVVISGRPARRR